MSRGLGTALLVAMTACGASLDESARSSTAPAPKVAPTAAPTAKVKPGAKGWRAVSAAERKRIDRFASEYIAFLGRAKTTRRAIEQLTALFPGTRPLGGKRIDAQPGSRYLIAGPGGKAAAFVLVGDRPIEEGARIVIASVDAPRVDLKQRPVYTGPGGFAMLDTVLYGAIELASWLTHPLALDIYVDRPGAAAGAARISVGNKAGDPVLVIPDLLPHLSRKIQRPAIVDSAERLDAIAAASQRKLFEFLRRNGVDAKLFASAEASLVPAAAPSFVGVDRGLVAGYGQSHRSLAYAAVKALAGSKRAHHTAIVIAIDGRENGYKGSAGTAFVGVALTTVFSALASGGDAVDMLTTRRIHARSAALMASSGGGKSNAGVVLNPSADDALPEATRRVLDSLATSGAHHQIAGKRREAPARQLGTLDIDVLGIGLPVQGHGTPSELLSALDLYQARKAFKGWLLQK